MDFSQVKSLTIPEGSVKQITDSQGRILWHKPTIYRELEYCKFNGNTYINLGTPIDHNDNISIVCSVDSNVNNYGLFGSRGSGANSNNISVVGANVNLYVDFNNGTYSTYRATISDLSYSNKYELTLNKNSRSIKEVSTGTIKALNDTVNSQIFSTANSAYLGWINATDTTFSNKLNGKIYSLIWSVSSQSFMNLVPVQRKSDNAVGFYNKVSGTFILHESAGDPLTAGPIVNEYPDWSN